MMALINNTIPEYVSKGWGYEAIICNSSLYCGKELFIKKGRKLSLHYHELKTETFYVNRGQVYLAYYDDPGKDKLFTVWSQVLTPTTLHTGDKPDIESIILKEGESFHIPLGRRHTLFAFFDSSVFEFSTQHFDSDSKRILKGD